MKGYRGDAPAGTKTAQQRKAVDAVMEGLQQTIKNERKKEFNAKVNIVIDALHGDREVPPGTNDLIVLAALYKVVKLLLKESNTDREVNRG